MNNFPKRDWSKISLIILWNLAIIGTLLLISSYFFDYQKIFFAKISQENEKKNDQELLRKQEEKKDQELLQAKEKLRKMLEQLKNPQQEPSIKYDEQNQTLKDGIIELQQKEESNITNDGFICPGEYNDPQKYAEDLVQFGIDNKNLSPDELMKKRYDTLLSNGCVTALFNIHSQGVMESVIKFADKEFGPPTNDVNKETKIRSVYYPLSGQRAGEADEEITFNFYIQGVWSEEPFTTRDIANFAANSDGLNNNHILYKFEAPDPINKKPAFYFWSIQVPDKENGTVFFTKIASLGKDVYLISFSKKIAEEDKDKSFTDWFEKNSVQYLGILDKNLPIDSLEKVFDKERESTKLIEKK